MYIPVRRKLAVALSLANRKIWLRAWKYSGALTKRCVGSISLLLRKIRLDCYSFDPNHEVERALSTGSARAGH